MGGPWVEGPQPVGGPSLGWGTASGEAQGTHTGCEPGPGSPQGASGGLRSRAATLWTRRHLTCGGDEAPLIPSLARASSLGLFFFRKLWEGFLKEGRGHEFTG